AEIDRAARVARLAAGLAVEPVVEHHDREVRWFLHGDGRERTEPHQRLAVAGDYGDTQIRPRERDPEPDHGGAAHRAPEIEVAVVVADRRDVVGGRAEPRDDDEIVRALGEQGRNGVAALEHHFTHTLRPISRCESSSATAWSPPNARSTAPAAMSAASSGRSIR